MILFSYLSTEWGVYICSSGPESLNQDTGGTKSEHSHFKGSNKKNCFTLSDTDKNHNIILRKYCTLHMTEGRTGSLYNTYTWQRVGLVHYIIPPTWQWVGLVHYIILTLSHMTESGNGSLCNTHTWQRVGLVKYMYNTHTWQRVGLVHYIILITHTW